MATLGPTDEEKRLRIIAANEEDLKPVLAELLQAGFEVESISDLYNKCIDYRRAIPLLLNWLSRIPLSKSL
jgi:hypothetical protein